MKLTLTILCLMSIMVYSCKHSNIDPKKYIKWINDDSNGLIQKKEMGDFEILVSYKPQEYVALIETERTEGGLNEYESRLKEIETNQYFTIRIDAKDKKTESLKVGIMSQEDYFSRIEYLTSSFYQDVYLVEGTDTIPCILHHFERTYHMTSYTDINLVFECKPNNATIKDKVLVVEDKVFGFGLLRFNFNAQQLKRIPKLTADT